MGGGHRPGPRDQGAHGASLAGVDREGDRILGARFATRYGPVDVRAHGFVDASGDAALCWAAGLPCRLPDREIYGSQQLVVEHLDESEPPDPADLSARVGAKAAEYGLRRHDGLAFFFPGRGTAVLNMTHIEAPLDPFAAAEAQLEGKAQADRVVEFLRAEFPEVFGKAAVRSYGLPGRRQTRWVQAVHQLTVDEVRAGTRFPDAVARTAWPIELHDTPDGYVWETFGADHLHYVPLRAMAPPEVANLLVAGRCVDGDAAALSSVRVMGPCAAMGHAAAHALDMAGSDGSVHAVHAVGPPSSATASGRTSMTEPSPDDPHRRRTAHARRRGGRGRRGRDGPADPLRRGARRRASLHRATSPAP